MHKFLEIALTAFSKPGRVQTRRHRWAGWNFCLTGLRLGNEISTKEIQGEPKQIRSRNTHFADKEKDYLIAKFQTREQTGQRADVASVSRLMKSEKDENGEQLFDCSEFLTNRQISSFFPVWPQSEVSTTKRSTRAMTMNKSEQKRRASYQQWGERWCLKFLFSTHIQSCTTITAFVN